MQVPSLTSGACGDDTPRRADGYHRLHIHLSHSISVVSDPRHPQSDHLAYGPQGPVGGTRRLNGKELVSVEADFWLKADSLGRALPLPRVKALSR